MISEQIENGLRVCLEGIEYELFINIQEYIFSFTDFESAMQTIAHVKFFTEKKVPRSKRLTESKLKQYGF